MSCSRDEVVETIEIQPVLRQQEGETDHEVRRALTRDDIKKNRDLLVPVYQQGNFGVQLGRIKHGSVLNISRVLIAHSVVYTVVLVVATATSHVEGIPLLLLNPTWLVPVMVAVFGVACTWFSNSLPVLLKPLSLFMVLRYMAVFIFFTAFASLFLHLSFAVKAFTYQSDDGGFLKYVVGGSSLILLCLDVALFWLPIASVSRRSGTYLDKYCCCCVGFEAGSELAPGVPNPLFVDTMTVFAKAFNDAA